MALRSAHHLVILGVLRKAEGLFQTSVRTFSRSQ